MAESVLSLAVPDDAWDPEAAKTHQGAGGAGACPDGGWRAWRAVLGAFLALACTFGQLSSFGTFQSWYAAHQLRALAPSTISWIGAVQLWVFFFSVRSPRAVWLDVILTLRVW